MFPWVHEFDRPVKHMVAVLQAVLSFFDHDVVREDEDVGQVHVIEAFSVCLNGFKHFLRCHGVFPPGVCMVPGLRF